jgi:hypothetical protein
MYPGTYKVSMTLEQTGQYELKVEINDLLVPLHPSTVTVTEKPISSAATSSFSGHSLLYQTGEKLQITVIARDEYRNLRTNSDDEFALTLWAKHSESEHFGSVSSTAPG